MTDDATIGNPSPAFDDDRLLAFVLSLDDDPELVAAAAADEGLRRRLDVVRADVEHVGAQVRRAVPAADDGYAEPSDPRWGGLREYFAAPAAKTRSRSSRWLRVLAPTLVVLVAVAAGIAVLDGQKGGTPSHSGALSTAAAPSSKATGQQAGGEATAADRSGNDVDVLHDQLDAYAVVVIARAKAATGAFQRFVVLRVLKGDGPHSVRLRVADQPAALGRLSMLFLRPQVPASPPPSAEATVTPAPGAGETTSTVGGLGAGPAVVYSYEGTAAVLRELPAGTDPASVTLP